MLPPITRGTVDMLVFIDSGFVVTSLSLGAKAVVFWRQTWSSMAAAVSS